MINMTIKLPMATGVHFTFTAFVKMNIQLKYMYMFLLMSNVSLIVFIECIVKVSFFWLISESFAI